MSQTLDLKPCPFCGCEKILDGYIRDGREIVCGECRASVAAFHPDASKRAAERWNRRAKAALSSDDEETYQIGVRDGYSQAVQDLDLLTGGDGEYRYCTDHDPERHTPDPPAMIQRIVDRFETLNLIKEAEARGDFWDAPQPETQSKCAICGGKHDNDVLTDICTDCETRINIDGSP